MATLTAPIAFATRARTAGHLQGFALAEHESMLEVRAAAARCTSTERRALYLRHALDEDRHATAFARHATEIQRSLGRGAFARPRTGTEQLFERLGEEAFLAFVHLGEARGRAQFEAYSAYFARRGDAKLRALFATLIDDERGHESYTRSLLVECAGGERQARSALRRMTMYEGLRRWRRAGQGLAAIVYRVAMIVLYVTLLPFALVVRWVRPSHVGWRN